MGITPLGLNVFVIERAQFGQERGLGSCCMVLLPLHPSFVVPVVPRVQHDVHTLLSYM